VIADASDARLPAVARMALKEVVAQLDALERRTIEVQKQIVRRLKTDPVAKHLLTVPGIGPIGAALRPVAGFEHEDELVAASIERAHARVALDPGTEIEELGVNLAAGGEQLRDMPPIHADIKEGAAEARGSQVPQAARQEHLKGRRAIAKERWWICPSPVQWPSIGTL
jgi:hypothetical protein